MTDVKVEQCDRDIWFQVLTAGRTNAAHIELSRRNIDSGEYDDLPAMRAIVLSRQAAEKAQQERDAGYIEGKGGVIPGATVFVSLITGDNMPCMSGDARDKLNPHKRRQFDDATRDLAIAIRSQGHE